MQSQPLTPHVGAEIRGLRLEDVDGERISELRELLAARGVVALRGLPLGPDELVELTSRFGAVLPHPMSPDPAHPQTYRLRTDTSSSYSDGDVWHSDLSWLPAPPSLTFLTLDEQPPVGGDTLFASATTLFDLLSPPLAELLRGLTATHQRPDGPERSLAGAVHPTVIRHPVSGRAALYVNEGYTRRIDQLHADESRAILDTIFRRTATSPEIQCRIRWQPGTVVIWDNAAVLHRSSWDYWPLTRSGWRLTIEGDRPQPVAAQPG